MRHIRLYLMVLVSMSAISSFAQMNSGQRSFANSLMSFMREEGFSPSLDDDDDIQFKKEGTSYWISIGEDGPFYVTLMRGNMGCEDADKNTVIAACHNANKTLRAGKAYYLENSNSVKIACEMFCASAEDYKYIFYRQLRCVDAYYNTVKEYYNEHEDDYSGSSSSAPFSFYSSDVANVDNDNNFISGWGQNIYDYKTRYLKPRITVNVSRAGKYTIYVKLIKPDGSLATGNSSPNGYSYSYDITMETGQHTYPISGWGSNTSGHWSAGSYRFEFYYAGKLIGSKSFKVL